MLLQALIEGLGLRAKVDIDTTDTSVCGAKSLYAVGAACILGVLTGGTGDDADVSAILAKLLDGGHPVIKSPDAPAVSKRVRSPKNPSPSN